MSRQENATKTLGILEEAWKTKSVTFLTDDYLYILVNKEPGKWQEASFVFSDGSLQIRELESEKALMFLIEEITTGLAGSLDAGKNYVIVSNPASQAKVTERIQSLAS